MRAPPSPCPGNAGVERHGLERRSEPRRDRAGQRISERPGGNGLAQDFGDRARVPRQAFALPRAVAAESRDVAMTGRERHRGVAECRPAREARCDPGDLERSGPQLAARGAREAGIGARPRGDPAIDNALRLHAKCGHRIGEGFGGEIRERARTQSPRPRKGRRERERELPVVEHCVPAGRAPDDVEAGLADRAQVPAIGIWLRTTEADGWRIPVIGAEDRAIRTARDPREERGVDRHLERAIAFELWEPEKPERGAHGTIRT